LSGVTPHQDGLQIKLLEIVMAAVFTAFGALTLSVRQQEGNVAHKNLLQQSVGVLP